MVVSKPCFAKFIILKIYDNFNHRKWGIGYALFQGQVDGADQADSEIKTENIEVVILGDDYLK